MPMAALAEEAAPQEEDGGYVYDEATGRWSSNKWLYDPATNTYIANTGPSSNNTIEDTDGTISDTGPDSNNQIDDNSTSDTDSTTNNTNQIDNNVSAQATSGSAGVDTNNSAGSATSGDAAAIATIMNALNSSSSLGGAYTFSQDVYGDVYGDIEIAPELIGAMANTTGQSGGDKAINYNVVNNNKINNKVDLGAESGDAGVLNNTEAGSARSGNAVAIANVLNLINSIIAADGSFVGTINIHGNLYGDILLNREGSPSLIASNAGSNPLSNGSMIANNTSLTDIINDIDLNASSGKASTDGNTNAGSAKSGSAKTNLVVMDLAGHQIDAKNAILVFVNVMGKWVGIIVDAPTGATAAVLGDDVTQHLIAQTGAGSNNQISSDNTTDTNVNAQTKNQIHNKITVNAHSGDATVSGNTNAGDATSGDASAGANVMNMVNSVFNLTGFMRVLFINVLDGGFWCGNFGLDGDNCGTDNKTAGAASAPTAPSVASVAAMPAAQVFSFIEHTGPWSNNTIGSEQEAVVDSNGVVLAANNSGNPASPAGVIKAAVESPQISIPLAIAGLVVFGALIYAVIRIVGSFRDRMTYSH